MFSERVDRIRRRARADLVRDRRHLRRYGMERGARLLEIGSYVGAFLEVARQLGCSAVGVDLNPDLCRYSIDRGHDVRNAPFSADDFDGEQFDGVWILNCFEELPDLDGTLHDVRRMLRPEGWLVIRTPNASFVCLAHAEQAGRWLRPVADANALLGMPFRRCLSVRGITTLFVRHGFGRVDVRGREFSSLGPEGCSAAWAASRPLRGAAYSVASRLAGQPVHPWLEVAASPRPDW